MWCYFDRDDVALVGLRTLNKFCARIESKWAKELMNYQLARGGEVVFKSIPQPEKQEWGTSVESMDYLLMKKKMLKEQIEKCIKIARDCNDQHLKNYLKNEFLDPLILFIRYTFKFSFLLSLILVFIFIIFKKTRRLDHKRNQSRSRFRRVRV
jgi:ferritin heavy chain